MADFWAGYLGGAIGIIAGNLLDIAKVRLQAGEDIAAAESFQATVRKPTEYLRGAAAPVVGYGLLNALLYMSYNRSLKMLDGSIFDPTKLAGVDLSRVWLAGVIGGLTTSVIPTPAELILCRVQLGVDDHQSSWQMFKHTVAKDGIRGSYLGRVVTSLRDSAGYGFYFWSYELSKRLLLSRQADPFIAPTAMEILLAGGIAGVSTWMSVYPLDVIKTRVQTQIPVELPLESTSLLRPARESQNALDIARSMYYTERLRAFYSGLGICSVRAFIVNAVQWYTYEAVMSVLR